MGRTKYIPAGRKKVSRVTIAKHIAHLRNAMSRVSMKEYHKRNNSHHAEARAIDPLSTKAFERRGSVREQTPTSTAAELGSIQEWQRNKSLTFEEERGLYAHTGKGNYSPTETDKEVGFQMWVGSISESVQIQSRLKMYTPSAVLEVGGLLQV